MNGQHRKDITPGLRVVHHAEARPADRETYQRRRARHPHDLRLPLARDQGPAGNWGSGARAGDRGDKPYAGTRWL